MEEWEGGPVDNHPSRRRRHRHVGASCRVVAAAAAAVTMAAFPLGFPTSRETVRAAARPGGTGWGLQVLGTPRGVSSLEAPYGCPAYSTPGLPQAAAGLQPGPTVARRRISQDFGRRSCYC